MQENQKVAKEGGAVAGNARIEIEERTGKPVITVLNKVDKADPGEICGVEGVRISAKRGEGFDGLLEAIENALPVQKARMTFLFPFSDIGQSALVRENGTVFSEEYTDQGLLMDCLIDTVTAQKIKKYLP